MQNTFGNILQTQWDWRAAGNFMFGGSGGALILMAAIASWPGTPNLVIGLAALVFVGLGLFLVWLEIGRPWRFLHVFFHPQTSWMTREASVSVLLFAATFTGVLMQAPGLLAAAGLLGFLFLYCQGRILRASKGIPAWREPAVVPLIMSTGLAEGAAILSILLIRLRCRTGVAAVPADGIAGLAAGELAPLPATARCRQRPRRPR